MNWSREISTPPRHTLSFAELVLAATDDNSRHLGWFKKTLEATALSTGSTGRAGRIH
jgi:hypothetical protein